MNARSKLRSTWIALVTPLWALGPSVAHACPMCFNGNSQNSDAFVYGSLFLMLMPTLALGGLGYWAYRRIKAAESAAEPPVAPVDPGRQGESVVLRVVERG